MLEMQCNPFSASVNVYYVTGSITDTQHTHTPVYNATRSVTDTHNTRTMCIERRSQDIMYITAAVHRA